jgi:hypothetical protein
VLFDHAPEWITNDKSKLGTPNKMGTPNGNGRGEARRLVLHDEDGSTKVEGDCRRMNTLAHYQVGTSFFH